MIRLKKKKRFKHIFSSLSQNIVLFGIKNERKTNWFDGLIEVDVWWFCWCALLNKPETTFSEVFLYDYYRSEFKNAQFLWTMTTPGHILFPFSAMRIYIYYIPQWCSIQHTKGTWIKITFYSHLLTAAERTIISLNSNFFLEIWTYTHRKNVRQRRKKLVFILFRHHVILLYILKFVPEENIFFCRNIFSPRCWYASSAFYVVLCAIPILLFIYYIIVYR